MAISAAKRYEVEQRAKKKYGEDAVQNARQVQLADNREHEAEKDAQLLATAATRGVQRDMQREMRATDRAQNRAQKAAEREARETARFYEQLAAERRSAGSTVTGQATAPAASTVDTSNSASVGTPFKQPSMAQQLLEPHQDLQQVAQTRISGERVATPTAEDVERQIENNRQRNREKSRLGYYAEKMLGNSAGGWEDFLNNAYMMQGGYDRMAIQAQMLSDPKMAERWEAAGYTIDDIPEMVDYYNNRLDVVSDYAAGIDERYGVTGGAERIAGDLGAAVSQVLSNKGADLMAPGLGTALTFSSSAEAARERAYASGATGAEAEFAALLAGFGGALLEKGDPMGGAADDVEKALTKSGAFKIIAKAMVDEGTEEIADSAMQEVITLIYDDAANTGKPVKDVLNKVFAGATSTEAIYSALMAAATSGILGGVNLSLQYADQRSDQSTLAAYLVENNLASREEVYSSNGKPSALVAEVYDAILQGKQIQEKLDQLRANESAQRDAEAQQPAQQPVSEAVKPAVTPQPTETETALQQAVKPAETEQPTAQETVQPTQSEAEIAGEYLAEQANQNPPAKTEDRVTQKLADVPADAAVNEAMWEAVEQQNEAKKAADEAREREVQELAEAINPDAAVFREAPNGNAEARDVVDSYKGYDIVRSKLDGTEASRGIKYFGNKFNRTVIVVDSLPNNARGAWLNGNIYITEAALQDGDGYFEVLKHELTHSIRGAKLWDKFEKYALAQYEQREGAEAYAAKVREITRDYSNLNGEPFTEADLREELVANYVQKYLFKDKAAVDALVKSQRSTAQLILQKLQSAKQSIVALFGADGGLQRDILKAERMFAQALAQTKNPATDGEADFDLRNTMGRSWKDQVDGLLKRSKKGLKIKSSDSLYLGNLADTLVIDGVDPLPISVPLGVITKAMSGKDDSHSIKAEQIKKLDGGMRYASAVIHVPSYRDAKGNIVPSIVFVTSLSKGNDPIVVTAAIKANDITGPVHEVTSIHVRKDIAKLLRGLGADAEIYLRNEKEFRRLVERSSAVQFDTLATKAKLIDASKTYPSDFVNPNTKFSLPDTDSQYMAAVESGDMETAQRMVKEAAEAAGYNEAGHHGTRRGDRVGNVFLPERATSGPFAYFTDNREIAENYSRDKADTSTAYDERYDNYHTQFRVQTADGDAAIEDIWYKLSLKDRNEIARRAAEITFDDDYENIITVSGNKRGTGGFEQNLKEARGNALKALVTEWLDSGTLYGDEARFNEVLDVSGINDILERAGYGKVEYFDPDATFERVYDVYMRAQNPFDTQRVDEAFVEDFMRWYSAQDADAYARESANADSWDKNNITAEQFAEKMRDDIANDRTNAWTSIPDSMSDYLRSQGFDIIKDAGGKQGGTGHTVWIPLGDSNSVKSSDPVTYDDNGNVIPLSQRFNPESRDIRYSLPSNEQTSTSNEEADSWADEFISREKDPAEETSVKELLSEEGRLYLNDTRVNADYAQALSNRNTVNLMSDTLPRVLDRVAGGNTKVRKWLHDFIEAPLNAGKGAYARDVQKHMDALVDIVEKSGIKAGTPQSAAVQWYGEGHRTVGDKVVPFTMVDLMREFPNDYKQIMEVEKWCRQVYDDYVDRINGSLTRIYPNAEHNEQVKLDKLLAERAVLERERERLQNLFDYDQITFAYLESARAGIESDLRELDAKIEEQQQKLISGDYLVGKRLQKRQDYFHHFKDISKQSLAGNLRNLFKGSATAIDPALVTVSEFTKPKTKWTGMLQRRTGERTDADAIMGMALYIPQAEYVVHIDPVIAHMRNVVSDLVSATKQTRNANGLIQYLTEYTNQLAGKTPFLDRALLNTIGEGKGRDILNALTSFNGRIKANKVVLNARSAMSQFLNLPHAVSLVKSGKAWGDAIKEYFSKNKNAAALLSQSDFLLERYLNTDPQQFAKATTSSKLGDFAGWVMEVGDRTAAELTWLAAYNEALRNGNAETAVEYADDITRRAVGGRGIGEIPPTLKNKVVDLIAPFQLEVNNSWQSVKGMIREKDFGALLRLIIASWAANELYSLLFGYEGVPDVLGPVIDGVKRAVTDKDATAGEIVGDTARNVAGNVVSAMPGASTFLPFLLGIGEDEGEALFGDASPTRYGQGITGLAEIKDLATDIAENGLEADLVSPALNVLLPYGGAQVARMYHGAQDLGWLPDNGILGTPFGGERHDVAGSYTDSGRLRFLLDDDLWTAVQTLFFGPYSTRAGQEYLETLQPYSESATQKMLDANRRGIDPELFLEAYEAQKGVDYTKGEHLAKSNAQKQAVDSTASGLSDDLLEYLYELFGISEQVW